MAHLPSSSATTFSIHGATFRSFARTETGARELAAWRTEFAPHTPGQPHTMSREEVLHVLAGSLALEVDGERSVVHQGDAALIPAGATLRVDNDSDEPAAIWAVTSLGMTATMGEGATMAPPWAQ